MTKQYHPFDDDAQAIDPDDATSSMDLGDDFVGDTTDEYAVRYAGVDADDEPSVLTNANWPSSDRPSVEQVLRAARITSSTRELDLSFVKNLTVKNLEILCECLPNLRKLSLRGSGLRVLPDAIYLLEHLRELDISHNELEDLPEALGELHYLQYLNVSFNKLEHLPQAISHLRDLRYLNASNNSLFALPLELMRLKKLRVLRLSANRLVSLPSQIGKLHALHLLQVSANHLRGLPPEIGELMMLKVLNVSNNSIRALPPQMTRLRRLTHLDVSKNQLQTIPAQFAQMHRLKTFEIGSNHIATLPGTQRNDFIPQSNKAPSPRRQGSGKTHPGRREAVTSVRGAAPQGGTGTSTRKQTSKSERNS